LFKGWYVPSSSMNLPSRGLRESATTMRYTGVFFVPTRFIRILTDINYVDIMAASLMPPADTRRSSQKEGSAYTSLFGNASPHFNFVAGPVRLIHLDLGRRGF
jgi:hypothetical protein